MVVAIGREGRGRVGVRGGGLIGERVVIMR